MAARSRRFNSGEWAEFWKVNVRTIQRWRKDGLPVDDPGAMAPHVLAITRADGPREVATRIELEKSGRTPESGEVPKEPDSGSDGKFYDVSSEEVESAQVNLKGQARFAWAQLQKATEIRDMGGVRFWNDQLLRIQKAIREDEAHARKMGIAEGDTMQRSEIERIFRALAFWMVQGVEKDVQALAPECLEFRYVEEAVCVLERCFMRKRFLGPFQKAMTTPSGVQLPDWLVATIRDAVDDFYEPGEGEEKDFEAFMALTAARPAEATG